MLSPKSGTKIQIQTYPLEFFAGFSLFLCLNKNVMYLYKNVKFTDYKLVRGFWLTFECDNGFNDIFNGISD